MAEESQDDQPSSVSNTQIHKEIRCVCALFVAANQRRDRLPLKTATRVGFLPFSQLKMCCLVEIKKLRLKSLK